MSRTFAGIVSLPFVALALSATACGGKSSSPSSPVSPSAAAPVSLPPASFNGATISGTLVTAGSSSSIRAVRAMASALTVTIVGTSVSTTVNASGNFTLQNVPPGNVTLTFSGNGVNAQLTLLNVTAQEQIQITVDVHGSAADLDDDEREESDNTAEIEGLIVSMNGTARTLVVGRRNIAVSVPVGTPIHHGGTAIDFSKLIVGERVHIRATRSGTMFTATDIEVQADNPGNPGPPPGDKHAEVHGTIVGLSGTCPALTFTVASTTVKTTASTDFEDTTCKALANGTRVNVEGTKQSDGSLLASEVQKGDQND